MIERHEILILTGALQSKSFEMKSNVEAKVVKRRERKSFLGESTRWKVCVGSGSGSRIGNNCRCRQQNQNCLDLEYFSPPFEEISKKCVSFIVFLKNCGKDSFVSTKEENNWNSVEVLFYNEESFVSISEIWWIWIRRKWQSEGTHLCVSFLLPGEIYMTDLSFVLSREVSWIPVDSDWLCEITSILVSYVTSFKAFEIRVRIAMIKIV